MKKILVVLVAVLAMCAVPTQAQQNDTISYAIQTVTCAYSPSDGDVDAGQYRMIFTFFNTTEDFPQLQFLLLVKDTLTITQNVVGVAGIQLVELNELGEKIYTGSNRAIPYWLDYDFVRNEGNNAIYTIGFYVELTDGRIYKGEYEGLVTFKNNRTQIPYSPIHEPSWEPVVEGFEQTETTAAPVKVLRNGQVLIVREGRMYDLCGRVVSLKN